MPATGRSPRSCAGSARLRFGLRASIKTSTLAADVIALHGALGKDANAVLIANDWGSVAAYRGAAREPMRSRRCVIMNVPPLGVFGQLAFRYDQIKRSFYFWFFQMQISDSIVPADDLAFIDGLWADWSPCYDLKEDLPRVKDCLRNPVNLRAAMGYYRALFDPARHRLAGDGRSASGVGGAHRSAHALSARHPGWLYRTRWLYRT
jgi:pimeloyl-ACP methyl ester carboxylesterase